MDRVLKNPITNNFVTNNHNGGISMMSIPKRYNCEQHFNSNGDEFVSYEINSTNYHKNILKNNIGEGFTLIHSSKTS
jgi:hypothetical protein